MDATEREQMNSLCQRIAQEKDIKTFNKLLAELNQLLQRKQTRLVSQSKKPDPRV